jgi:hypothetical protein
VEKIAIVRENEYRLRCQCKFQDSVVLIIIAVSYGFTRLDYSTTGCLGHLYEDIQVFFNDLGFPFETTL